MFNVFIRMQRYIIFTTWWIVCKVFNRYLTHRNPKASHHRQPQAAIPRREPIPSTKTLPSVTTAKPQRHHSDTTATPQRHHSDIDPREKWNHPACRPRAFGRPRGRPKGGRAAAPPRSAGRPPTTAGRWADARERGGAEGGGEAARRGERGRGGRHAAAPPAEAPPRRGNDRRAGARAARGRPAIEEDHQQPERPPFSPVHGRGGAKKTPVILYGGMGRGATIPSWKSPQLEKSTTW